MQNPFLQALIDFTGVTKLVPWGRTFTRHRDASRLRKRLNRSESSSSSGSSPSTVATGRGSRHVVVEAVTPVKPTRGHLIEIHDQSWCPAVVRNAVVDVLRFGWTLDDVARFLPAPLRRLAPVHAFRAVLQDAVSSTRSSSSRRRRVLDLASGMGGPMLHLAKLMPEIEITISDLHPHPEEWRALTAGIPNASFVDRSLSAADVGADEVGVRTVMAAFHHFGPPLATRVLASAVRDGQPIVVAELTDRSLLAMITVVLLIVPLALIRGVQALLQGRFTDALLFTLLPVNTAVLAIDGIVSCWRTYTAAELLWLAEQADPDDQFDWYVTDAPAATALVPWFRLRCLRGEPKTDRQ